MDQELQQALLLATDLARRAGELLMRRFRTDLPIEHKPGNEPVTEADRESEALILDGLRRSFPAYGILSEEQEDKESWAQYRRAWVIDPLDGTRDFIAGLEGFSVMIGLLEEFRPILGVVYQPAGDLTFQAVSGYGCTLLQGEDRTILRTTRTQDLASIRLVVSKSHRASVIDEIKQTTGITDELNVGSVGLKISLIARGERDLYINPQGKSKLWDICAPEVILTEACGRLTDLHGDPICYCPEELRLCRGLVASNGACHEAVIHAIAPLFPRDQH